MRPHDRGHDDGESFEQASPGLAAEYLQPDPTRPEPPKVKLTVRKPSEILALPDDPDDNLLGDRLLSKGNALVILGPGGCHKSRLLLQMAACCASGKPFMGLPTNALGKRWLILQAENDNRRLQFDLGGLRQSLTPEEFSKFDELVTIHTLENEWDCMLALSNPDDVLRMAEMIEATSPDIVGVDSFYNVSVGDLNKDVEMRASCVALSQLVKRGNPRRAMVVLHHALTGKAGAVKSTGWERSSYGRNSKLLHSWTRGQINVAPGSEDGSSIVLSCGKASNGREFERMAARLNEFGVLEPFPGFDFEAWETEIGDGATRARKTVGIEEVAKLCADMTKTALVKAIMDEFGVGKSYAYRLIESAAKSKLISRSPVTQRYNRR